ncbi:MAG: SufE family protein [Bacteroidetes bacterium]|nr:SufE family protein [Bacteroidota bacterium]
MSSIKQIEEEIISDFELFDSWEEKYHYIIELGQKLAPLDDKYKVDEYKIKGCQSSVWLNGEERDGKLFFSADSDSTFVKGEIALLMMVLSGQAPEDILDAKLEFIDALGLRQHIAVTRANGLASMIKQMKTYAFAMTTANK